LPIISVVKYPISGYPRIVGSRDPTVGVNEEVAHCQYANSSTLVQSFDGQSAMIGAFAKGMA
jgi:hypothetical protein